MMLSITNEYESLGGYLDREYDDRERETLTRKEE